MFLRLFNPEVFQGNLGNKHYFEGWYFKNVNQDMSSCFSFIPGISLFENDRHAFIQVINGSTGSTDYIRYQAEEFSWDKKKVSLNIGSSIFTDEGLKLDISNDRLKLTGQIEFRNMIRYPKTLFSPGIMGWYSFVPFMECKHGIISANHNLTGSLNVNGKIIDLTGGKGYIEKDWGVSFPEAWLWIQSNNFGEHETSFSFSIAKIPWLGRFFIGFIAYLYLRGEYLLFSTYNRSAVTEIYHDNNSIRISLKNKDHILKIRVIKKSFGDLRAPVFGEMSRRIKESIDSEVHVQLLDKSGDIKYEDTGQRVGLEVIEKIFDYIHT